MTSKSIYIDCNVKSSRVESENNNRYHYPLENTLSLPAGTQVSLNTSLINLEGTVGESITLTENFEEEMLIGFYLTDTFYETPSKYTKSDERFTSQGGAVQQTCIGLSSCLADGLGRVNYEFGTGLEARDDQTLDTLAVQVEQGGHTEAPFPLVRVNVTDTEKVICTPVVHKVKLSLPAGTYAVDDFARRISDQINGRANEFFTNKTNVDYFRETNDRGIAVQANNSCIVTGNTLRRPLNGGTNTPAGGANIYPFQESRLLNYAKKIGTDRVTLTAINDMFNEAGAGFIDKVELGIGEVSEFFYDANGNAFMEDGTTPAYQRIGKYFGLAPDHYNEIVTQFKERTRAEIEAPAVNNNPNNINIIHFDVFCQSLVRTYKGVELRTVICPQSVEPEVVNSSSAKVIAEEAHIVNYNAGSFDFTLGYDNQKGNFSLSTLHQSRRQPTHDLTCNTMPSPLAISVYSKRATEDALFDERQLTSYVNVPPLLTNQYTGAYAPASTEQKEKITGMMNKIMSRLSGCFVINWSLKVADANATKTIDTSDTGTPFFKNFARFQDYFNTIDEASNAWRKTIWYRLGFNFSQIQGERCYEKHNISFTGTDAHQLRGFTTDLRTDASIIPSISTLYNPYSIAGGTDDPVKISSGTIQTGNGLEQNVPESCLVVSNGFAVKDYLSSFYSRSVMSPIETAEVPILAERLPELETDGYLVITTNSFSKTDTLKKKVPSMLLDMVPISNLNSRDFIQNTNLLTHTLTNPVVLNEININILRPDLTDVALRENSTILLNINVPEPIAPLVIKNAELEVEENQILKNEENVEKGEKK